MDERTIKIRLGTWKALVEHSDNLFNMVQDYYDGSDYRRETYDLVCETYSGNARMLALHEVYASSDPELYDFVDEMKHYNAGKKIKGAKHENRFA